MTARRETELLALEPETRDLLARRAQRIRKPQADAAGEGELVWIAAFAIGGEQYAIPLAVLRAVLPLRAVAPVPRSSRAVVGVAQFEGAVIAVLSTASLLGVRSEGDPGILLVVDCGDEHTVGLDCAQVPLVMTIPASCYADAAAVAGRPVAAVHVPGRDPVSVIDVARLLDAQDWRGADGRS